MSNVSIKIKKLREDVILPSYALNGDAGMDVFSLDDVVINSGERHVFPLGFATEIPNGYCALIWDKSGLSSKYGLKVLGGVIDSNYRGEYMVCIINLGEDVCEIKKGNKIAQILIQPIIQAEFIEVENLNETDRGLGKWGSTGS